MLQTSPLATPELPVPIVTLEVTTLPPAQDIVPTLAPPTSVPLPPAPAPTATAGVPGFLPAPTIVNPNDIQSLPLAQPPVSGSDGDSEPLPTPTRPAGANSTVRAAVALLNYLWLLCGGMLLVGGAVAIILLWRRDRRS